MKNDSLRPFFFFFFCPRFRNGFQLTCQKWSRYQNCDSFAHNSSLLDLINSQKSNQRYGPYTRLQTIIVLLCFGKSLVHEAALSVESKFHSRSDSSKFYEKSQNLMFETELKRIKNFQGPPQYHSMITCSTLRNSEVIYSVNRLYSYRIRRKIG